MFKGMTDYAKSFITPPAAESTKETSKNETLSKTPLEQGLLDEEVKEFEILSTEANDESSTLNNFQQSNNESMIPEKAEFVNVDKNELLVGDDLYIVANHTNTPTPEISQKLASLEKDLSEKIVERQILASSLEELCRQQEILVENNEQTKSELDQQKYKFSQLSAKLASVEKSLSDKTEERQILANSLEELCNQKAELVKSNDQIKREVDQQKHLFSQVSEKLASVEKSLSDKTKERQILADSLEELCSQKEVLAENSKHTKKDLESLKERFSELEQTIKSLENDLSEKTTERKILADSIEELYKQKETDNKEIKKREAQLSVLQTKIDEKFEELRNYSIKISLKKEVNQDGFLSAKPKSALVLTSLTSAASALAATYFAVPFMIKSLTLAGTAAFGVTFGLPVVCGLLGAGLAGLAAYGIYKLATRPKDSTVFKNTKINDEVPDTQSTPT